MKSSDEIIAALNAQRPQPEKPWNLTPDAVRMKLEELARLACRGCRQGLKPIATDLGGLHVWHEYGPITDKCDAEAIQIAIHEWLPAAQTPPTPIETELYEALRLLEHCFDDQGELHEEYQDELSVALEKATIALLHVQANRVGV